MTFPPKKDDRKCSSNKKRSITVLQMARHILSQIEDGAGEANGETRVVRPMQVYLMSDQSDQQFRLIWTRKVKLHYRVNLLICRFVEQQTAVEAASGSGM